MIDHGRQSSVGTLCGLALCLLSARAGAADIPPSPWNAAAPPVRDLLADDQLCWAVGDAGLILRSLDAGKTWARLPSEREDHFQAAGRTEGAVHLYGGRAEPGQPQGAASATILRTDDAGLTFKRLNTPDLSWLYGGTFAEQAAIVYGQAAPGCPGGLWRSVSAGRRWAPLPVAGTGFALGGHFPTFRLGYVVGRNHRIVKVLRMREPHFRPPELATTLSLRDARFLDDQTCWAVGDRGTVLRSAPRDVPWTRMAVPLPRGLRRLADFEAVAADRVAGRLWIGGGLLGVLAHSPDRGRTWTLLPAPGPGAVHALTHVRGDVVLAAGDAGRIWRSADAGKSWRLVHGRERTDVLFILAAADHTHYPAMVAHALAGAGVAAVYATAPTTGGYPPVEPLRAAAAAAGVGGTTVLTDFPSLSADPAADGVSEEQVLDAWSAALDTQPAPHMELQLAAAIRLYRPAVVAVGAADGAESARENRLVARLASRAAALAADAGKVRSLARAGLPPWTVQRVFVGDRQNERSRVPGEPRPARDRSRPTTVIDSTALPAGVGTTIGMLAQDAIWRLPWTDLPTRPARFIHYRCRTESRRLPLMTTGLSPARLRLRSPEPAEREVADMSSLRLAAAGGRPAAAALPRLAALAEKFKDPRAAALAADRILQVWASLLAEGRLVSAEQAFESFLKFGRDHPLHRRMNVVALADAVSGEWAAQFLLHGRPPVSLRRDYGKALQRFAQRRPWSRDPAAQMLLAKGLAVTGRGPAAAETLKKLAASPSPLPWRRKADLELQLLNGTLKTGSILALVVAHPNVEKGKLDGILDEPAWRQARPVPLRPGAKTPKDANAPAGSFQVLHTPTHAIWGIRLPRRESQVWRVQLAIDADRDAWTQLVFTCDTLGRRKTQLVRRLAPPADVGRGSFLVAARKTDDAFTFEIALPLAHVGDNPAAGGLWNFQLIARSGTGREAATLAFLPQPDARLLPERYGMLLLRPLQPPKPVPRPVTTRQ